MRRTYLFCGVVGCALVALWSCGLDDSAVVAIGDDDASTGDGSAFDGTAPTDSSTDTGVSDGGTSDTGVDSGPCPLTDLPICDNGTCGSASEVCTPPISSGWTVVNYISGSRPACSAGYTAHDVVEIADGGPSSCACNCATGGSTPTCENAHLHVGTGSVCDTTSEYDLNAGCVGLAVALGFSGAEATVSVAAANTCAGETDASFPNPDGGLGRECALQPDAGAANLCADHRSCVAKPATGNICIAHASPATCPNGFTQKNVADSYGDTRSCTSCACAWSGTGCTVSTVSAYTVPACATGGAAISQSACDTVSGGPFASFGLMGTDVAPTCGLTDGGAFDGGVAITNDTVICCAN